MDLGLARRSARIIPRRNGECLLEAITANDIVVDDHSLHKGYRRRLRDGSEVYLGGVGLIYRSP
jgi:predicted component of type VI protein secretion system